MKTLTTKLSRWLLMTLTVIMTALLPHLASAQLGSKVVVGYFHNWNNAQAPYHRLRDVNSKYNVINIAFATPVSHGDMNMTFVPTQQSKAEFIADIRALQSQGRRVQISIGGADAPVELKTANDRNNFVATMKTIIDEYGFDGFDIDLEGTSVILDAGDNNFKTPTTSKIANLISASRELTNYYRGQGKNFWLTAAPEVQYVQGGYANYGTAFGGYLPVLYGIRDLLTFVHVQYYNTGTQVALDEKIYAQSTSDFIVSMTEMLLRGFPVGRNTGNMFPALRQDQVAFGLPATGTGAAPAGGYVTPANINRALDYLTKGISYGGQYVTIGTYPNIRGIMTWSINWDKTLNDAWVNNAYAYFSNTGGNISPSTSISSPTNNATFTPGSTIAITATAVDSDGTISKVEFYQGTTKLGEDTSSPYTFNWTNVAAGSYALTTKATDNLGATGTSTVVNVGVGNANPTTSITSPANNTTFTPGTSITISASASDQDGTISKVEFFQGATKLGEDTSSPYSFTWNNVSAGNYTLTTKATDNAGGTGTSQGITVSVSAGCNVAAWNAATQYNGTARVSRSGNIYEAKWWTQGDDPLLKSGPDDVWKLIGPCGNNASPTASITAPANGVQLTAPACVTINVTASDSDGAVAKVEFYQGNTKLGEDTTTPYSFSWCNVAAGNYALTARAVDNLNATGTSGVINIAVNNGGNVSPTTSLTSPANNATFTAGTAIALAATANDTDGTIVKVEFFAGGTKLGEDLSAPYTFSWTNAAVGTYNLTSRATDNAGATGTSAIITISVSTTDNCTTTPQYVENGGYIAGSIVKNAGSRYECKPHPFTGWCNGAAWAYAPGTGLYWSDAWILKGTCSGARSATSEQVLLQEQPSEAFDADGLTMYPNPSVAGQETTITFTFLDDPGMIDFSLRDANGVSVMQIENKVVNRNTFRTTISGLPAGVYIIRIRNAKRSWVKKYLVQ
ncbi:Ig-like domain-containing protein [Pseudochryseolinea flava]|nr:Ig-like domain-containing protein [Pseudochryseolinea flava]